MRTASSPVHGLQASGIRVAVVASDYHREIHDRLLAGAMRALEQAGGAATQAEVFSVDGIFDVPALAGQALEGPADAVVVLGCVVQGETRHDQHIAQSVLSTLSDLAARHRKPVALGVLTVESLKQAKARSGGSRGDAGAFAMNAAIRSVLELRRMRKVSPSCT